MPRTQALSSSSSELSCSVRTEHSTLVPTVPTWTKGGLLQSICHQEQLPATVFGRGGSGSKATEPCNVMEDRFSEGRCETPEKHNLWDKSQTANPSPFILSMSSPILGFLLLNRTVSFLYTTMSASLMSTGISVVRGHLTTGMYPENCIMRCQPHVNDSLYLCEPKCPPHCSLRCLDAINKCKHHAPEAAATHQVTQFTVNFLTEKYNPR